MQRKETEMAEKQNTEVFDILQATVSQYVMSCLQTSVLSILQKCEVKTVERRKKIPCGETQMHLLIEGSWSKMLMVRQRLIEALAETNLSPSIESATTLRVLPANGTDECHLHLKKNEVDIVDDKGTTEVAVHVQEVAVRNELPHQAKTRYVPLSHDVKVTAVSSENTAPQVQTATESLTSVGHLQTHSIHGSKNRAVAMKNSQEESAPTCGYSSTLALEADGIHQYQTWACSVNETHSEQHRASNCHETDQSPGHHQVRKNKASIPVSYCCDICGLQFSDQGPLSNHKKVHKQPIVGVGFSVVPAEGNISHDLLNQSIIIQQHFTCDMPTRPQYRTCNLCHGRFRGRSSALEHLKQKHKHEYSLATNSSMETSLSVGPVSDDQQESIFPVECPSSCMDSLMGDQSSTRNHRDGQQSDNPNCDTSSDRGPPVKGVMASSQSAGCKDVLPQKCDTMTIADKTETSQCNVTKHPAITCEIDRTMNGNKLLSLASALTSLENLTSDTYPAVMSLTSVLPNDVQKLKTEVPLSKMTLHPKRTLMMKNPRKAIARCRHCGFKTSRAGLIHHMKRYHATRLYQCPVCPRKFGMVSDLARHQRSHFSASGKQRPLNWRLGYRYRREDQAPLCYCDVCNKGFYRKVDLMRHRASHNRLHLSRSRQKTISQKNKFSDVTLLECHLCDYKTNTSYRLRLHDQRVHTVLTETNAEIEVAKKKENERWSCVQCCEEFDGQDGLDQHTQVVHALKDVMKRSDNTWPCPICQRLFKQRRYLHDHMLRHTGKKRHFCPVCNKGFLEHYKMLQHKEIHKEEGRFEYLCKICGRGFRNQSYLCDHENTHTGRRPYACDECGHTFTLASALSRHKLQHMPLTLFTCTHPGCTKSFKLATQLKLHMNIHTPDHQYKCLHCNKQYARRSTLRHHRCKAVVGKMADGANREDATTNVIDSSLLMKGNASVIEPASALVCDRLSEAVDVSSILPVSSPSSHVTESDGNCIYLCSVCNMRFSEWGPINAHMTQHRDDGDHSLGHTISTVTIEADVVHEETILSSEVETYPTVQIISAGEGIASERVIMMHTADGTPDEQILQLSGDFPIVTTLPYSVSTTEAVMVPVCNSSNVFPSDLISPVEYDEISSENHVAETDISTPSEHADFIQ